MFGANRVVKSESILSYVFEWFWHDCLRNLQPHSISSQIFCLISSFYSNRQICLVLDGLSHVFLLLLDCSEFYSSFSSTNSCSSTLQDLRDGITGNITILADMTAFYCMCEQAVVTAWNRFRNGIWPQRLRGVGQDVSY